MLRLAWLALVLGAVAPAQGDEVVAAYEAGEARVVVEGSEQVFPFRLHRPAGASAEDPRPLLVFLHGRGENGRDNRKQLRWLPEWMVTEPHLKRRGAFVLAVQTDTAWTRFEREAGRLEVRFEDPVPAMRAVLSRIRHLAVDPAVDRTRIYATGLSLGGFGTWDLIARHPEWFAAAVPVCGGADVRIAPRLAASRLPIWNVHGGADPIVPPERSRTIVEALRREGAFVGHTELPGVRHDAWSFAYGPKGAMEWLFAQRRPVPAEIPAPR